MTPIWQKQWDQFVGVWILESILDVVISQLPRYITTTRISVSDTELFLLWRPVPFSLYFPFVPVQNSNPALHGNAVGTPKPAQNRTARTNGQAKLTRN